MATSPGPIDILVVEDNPHDADLILESLATSSLSVRALRLRDGVEALAYLFHTGEYSERGASMPRLVLLDLKLPKVDGLEVLRKIKSDSRTEWVPVVVLTSSSEPKDVKASYQLGANSYIVKPVGFVEFRSILERAAEYWLTFNCPYAVEPAQEMTHGI